MENNNFSALYSDTDKQILKQAEDSLNPQIDRINEDNCSNCRVCVSSCSFNAIK